MCQACELYQTFASHHVLLWKKTLSKIVMIPSYYTVWMHKENSLVTKRVTEFAKTLVWKGLMSEINETSVEWEKKWWKAAIFQTFYNAAKVLLRNVTKFLSTEGF